MFAAQFRLQNPCICTSKSLNVQCTHWTRARDCRDRFSSDSFLLSDTEASWELPSSASKFSNCDCCSSHSWPCSLKPIPTTWANFIIHSRSQCRSLYVGMVCPFFMVKTAVSLVSELSLTFPNSHIKEFIVKIYVSYLHYTIDIKHKCFVNKQHSSQWILSIWDSSACHYFFRPSISITALREMENI